jgi:tRNA(His) guanylyltransferase
MLQDFSIFKASEAALDTRLPTNGLAVLRLDGSNFSSLTRQFEKPFSALFEDAMNAAAIAVVREVLPNALVAYVASDEISLVISDGVAQLPYGGRVQKLTSLAAAVASVAFLRAIPTVVGTPAFDARVLELQDPAHIREYVTWRRLDCRKNATSMAAGHLKSHKELHGVSTRARGDLLVGTQFEKIAEGTFNGRFVTKNGEVSVATRELTDDLCEAATAKHLLHTTPR